MKVCRHAAAPVLSPIKRRNWSHARLRRPQPIQYVSDPGMTATAAGVGPHHVSHAAAPAPRRMGSTMNRREGLAILAALCVDAPLTAHAQTLRTARRIAYLGSVTTETDEDRLAEFRRELRGLGYVEGET